MWLSIAGGGFALALVAFTAGVLHGGGPVPGRDLGDAYVKDVQPLLKKYCFACHSKKVHKGDLDLEQFASLGVIRKDVGPWQHLIERVEGGEMPPRGKPRPSADECKLLLTWVRAMLDSEARARTGDPGRVPLRRLSNAEYDATIRDLTGVDLRPTREFPADGAGGEGFTNAAESLSDITPALLTRYLSAAKDIADHAIILPDGFRFSPGKTRRDWTDKSLARLRQFYATYTSDGRLVFQPYLLATVRHREALAAGRISLAEVAAKEKLNTKYLAVLWQTLTDRTSSAPLDRLRARWREASAKEVAPLAAEIAEWQKALWKFVPIGSYRHGNTGRQVANDPTPRAAVPLKLAVKPAPGQREVVLYLATRELSPAGKKDRVVWQRPRFEGAGKAPLLLKEYPPSGLIAAADSVTEIRLPAALFRDREFVVEGTLDGPPGERIVLFDVTTTAPGRDLRWNGKSPAVASPGSTTYKRMLAGFDDFRRCFPWYLCFPNVVPTDEVVSLKMFHREDEPLERLFLDAEQQHRIDRLWDEHRFISRQPVVENNYLPQFIGFVTQDQPKALLDYFESQRPVFKKRADEFARDSLAAEPKQLAALVDFAARAYRRLLQEKEKTALLTLYQKLRQKGVSHDEAFRGALTRVLVAPAFLLRIEKAPPGMKAGPIDDWELATRLSYFLWSSLPDDELRRLAAAGTLRDPKVLADQTRRMLKDPRLRALAIEFGTQWLHVRNFDTLKEKNERLFPTFNPTLRQAIYEESILFFLDLFQNDRAVTQILDADYTFLNETLAKHYGIPGVSGQQWRRVEGVRRYGRGGILGLASVQAKQSGASRTSPVLRGNWVVETLLGEKLPRPPANVPILPDEEGGAGKGTTRQQVEKHVAVAACAVCHARIDPYGFAFENFDAIGRWRVKETGGLPVDARARLRDGTEFEGIEGLRHYLLTKKKDVIVRLFCQKLLGYALGRATTLSDTSLIEEMVSELNKNDRRLSAAVLTIVQSPQFRMIRGSGFEE
jgi:Protein of unknown function (DUF1592)/Protein of unknown function (DUF1588)/Protein of unknown function (DUF1587)/Protein of unknown function (DUF1585)/Protein of unknown function (DUF1595)/Planctomycete cytochrome C